MENYKLEAHPGNNFDDVAKQAKQIAIELNRIVEYDFNGVLCLVDKNTNTEFLYRDYSNSWAMEWKTVGPDCLEKYPDDIQSDLDNRNKIKAEKQRIAAEEYRIKEEKEIKEFNERVAGIVLELSNEEGWNKSREVNTDPYGKAALDYAEGWAKLMQVEISKGKTITECADECQKGLGFLGITGFQYGCAVNILSQTWKHGEELRKWHNKKYGRSEETKGVVNPAVLTIGK